MSVGATEIVVLLDRSGSMQTQKSDHEGGLRSFVDDQKSLAGDVRFTLIQFDTESPCDVIYDGVPITDVKDIFLIPRGGTPLLDAVLKSTAHVERRIGADKPNVLFMIITDGEENSSREAKRDVVKQRIADLESKGWVFLFLGANIDAFHEASSIGASVVRACNFVGNAASVAALYDDMKGKAWTARRSSAIGNSLDAKQFEYSDADKEQILSGNVQCSNAAAGKNAYLAALNNENKEAH